jgi:hypothetical protein
VLPLLLVVLYPRARIRDHCLHHHFGRNRASHDAGVSESHRQGSFFPRLTGLDLLSDWTRLDPLVLGVALVAIEKSDQAGGKA